MGVTGVSLDCIRPLLKRDKAHPEKPRLTKEGMQLSLELVQSTYALEYAPWAEAGWQDIRLQIDHLLTDPLEKETEAGRGQYRQAQELLNRRDPITQVAGTLRQARTVDTCKAMVMGRREEKSGKIVIAISFMGTSQRIFDWVSNLRMQQENGRHRGFMQLTRQFLEREGEITFPAIAEALGRDALTLGDILRECTREETPFLLLLTGHSQGAAVAQLYMEHLLSRGVRSEHIAGYAFASPSVLEEKGARESYPMFHILNADDVVPRMGARFHLGDMLMYVPDADFRRACYGWGWEKENVDDRKLVRNVTGLTRNTQMDLIVTAAYLRLLREAPLETLKEGMRSLGHPVLWLPDTMTENLQWRLERGIDRMIDFAADAYESIFETSMEAEHVVSVMHTIRRVESVIGMQRFARAFGELCMEPHRVQPREGTEDAAYARIVRQEWNQLRRIDDTAFWSEGEQA